MTDRVKDNMRGYRVWKKIEDLCSEVFLVLDLDGVLSYYIDIHIKESIHIRI